MQLIKKLGFWPATFGVLLVCLALHYGAEFYLISNGHKIAGMLVVIVLWSGVIFTNLATNKPKNRKW